MIQQAEASRARIFQAPGELSDKLDSNRFECKLNSELAHSVMVDENYLMVGLHVDDNTKLKIITGQYVELEKLLVRDKLVENEDQRMQIVNRGNQTFWVPIKEMQHIHNFGKWEQAFRVFTNIYVQKFPQRSSELIQYSHLIHTASLSYVWDNVYSYDKDFRLHLSCFPSRSWSIILQQAWAICLKDRIRVENHYHGSNFSREKVNQKDNTFRRFSKGRCTFGASCKFEHRCKYCGKYGHGIHNCRKLKADKANGIFDKTVTTEHGGSANAILSTPIQEKNRNPPNANTST